VFVCRNEKPVEVRVEKGECFLVLVNPWYLAFMDAGLNISSCTARVPGFQIQFWLLENHTKWLTKTRPEKRSITN